MSDDLWSDGEVDFVASATSSPHLGRTYIDVWLDEEKARAFVDPGSDANFISSTFYQKHLSQYPLEECRCKVTGFGDNLIAFDGEIQVPISLGGLTTQVHRFKVYSKMTYDALLGDKLMRTFGVQMSFNVGERMVVEGIEIPTYNWNFADKRFVETQDMAAKLSKARGVKPYTGDYLELVVDISNFR
jgi:hypothetical protein